MKPYFLFIFLFPFCCFSRFKIPEGFTEFIESSANKGGIKRIVIDFDKDKNDDVFTVINSSNEELAEPKKYVLIYLSSKNKLYYIDFDLFHGVYIMPLRYKNNVFEFQVFEQRFEMYGHRLKLRYNPEYKDIQLIGYDYSYRIGDGGYVNKTYNVLTGKYKVTNYFYSIHTKKMRYSKFKGKKERSQDIFIGMFSNELFEDLSTVGRRSETD